MKFESPLFDRIRIKPEAERTARPQETPCDHEGCDKPATHRAPVGRGREGEFHQFCLAHVQEYNKSYNYFAGMNDAELDAYSREGMTGHRPTWKMGGGTKEERTQRAWRFRRRNPWSAPVDDPFDISGLRGSRGKSTPDNATDQHKRRVGNAARAAFEALGLDLEVPAEEIRKRYKELVKRHHPDANGGDRASEDRLREIIQAYATLKAGGFTNGA